MSPFKAVREELRRFKTNKDLAQAQVQSEVGNQTQEIKIFISFRILDRSQYCVSIEDVKEVASFQPPKPYPYPVQGHLGVVNLRGTVIPVIALGNTQLASWKDTASLRLLIVYANESEIFALIVSQIKKIQFFSVPENKIMNLENSPVRFLSKTDLNALIGDSNANGA